MLQDSNVSSLNRRDDKSKRDNVKVQDACASKAQVRFSILTLPQQVADSYARKSAHSNFRCSSVSAHTENRRLCKPMLEQHHQREDDNMATFSTPCKEQQSNPGSSKTMGMYPDSISSPAAHTSAERGAVLAYFSLRLELYACSSIHTYWEKAAILKLGEKGYTSATRRRVQPWILCKPPLTATKTPERGRDKPLQALRFATTEALRLGGIHAGQACCPSVLRYLLTPHYCPWQRWNRRDGLNRFIPYSDKPDCWSWSRRAKPGKDGACGEAGQCLGILNTHRSVRHLAATPNYHVQTVDIPHVRFARASRDPTTARMNLPLLAIMNSQPMLVQSQKDTPVASQ